MTRIGKIARLPRNIRDQLNQRLDDGELAASILAWLNGLDAVRKILGHSFQGRPVSEQNLSDWKQGGFLDWQRHQETAHRLQRLIDHAAALEKSAGRQYIPDLLAGLLASEFAAQTHKLLEETSDPAQRWKLLRQSLRQLHQLRKGDARAARAHRDAVRWKIECDDREWEQKGKMIAEAYDHAMEPIRQKTRRPVLVNAYGGGKDAEEMADFILNLERQCNIPRYSRFQNQPDPPPATPPESSPIKANQGKSS